MTSDRTGFVPRRTAESAAMAAAVSRAWQLTTAINRLSYGDTDQARAMFGELIGKELDSSIIFDSARLYDRRK